MNAIATVAYLSTAVSYDLKLLIALAPVVLSAEDPTMLQVL